MTRIANEGYSSQDDLEGHDKISEVTKAQNNQESELEEKCEFGKRIESSPLIVSVEMDQKESQVDVVYKSYHNTNVDVNQNIPSCDNQEKRRSIDRRRRKECRKRAHTLPKGDIMSQMFFEGTLTPHCEKRALETLFDEREDDIPLAERIHDYDEGLAQRRTVRIEIPKEIMCHKSTQRHDYSTIGSYPSGNDESCTQKTSSSNAPSNHDFRTDDNEKISIQKTSSLHTNSKIGNCLHENDEKIQSYSKVSTGCQCIIL